MGENNSQFKELLENLPENAKKEQDIKENQKRINAKKYYKKFKDFYYTVSHDEYYATKKKLDDNVELKKIEHSKEMVLKKVAKIEESLRDLKNHIVNDM